MLWADAGHALEEIVPGPWRLSEAALSGTSIWVGCWTRQGGRPGGGADGNIRIMIQGTTGISPDLLLDKSGYDDFESGDRDIYDVGTLNIGDVEAIAVSNEGANSGSDWFLEWD